MMIVTKQPQATNLIQEVPMTIGMRLKFFTENIKSFKIATSAATYLTTNGLEEEFDVCLSDLYPRNG